MTFSTLNHFPDLSATRIHYWSSDWGTEWMPHTQSANQPIDIAVEAGRSSKGYHPFLIVEDGERSYILAIMWSGNWSLKTVASGNSLTVSINSDNPNLEVLTHSANHGGMDAASRALIASFRAIDTRHSHPKLKMEWNSWWPYEDVDVNERVIIDNATVAKKIGLEVAVLDAGWFGTSDASSHWYDYRGDWNDVNSARFPHGLARLGDSVRAQGIDFGIWMEIEALGVKSRTAVEFPGFMAKCDGEDLGYLCFGNPDGYQWATVQIQHLINTCKATWLKIDFNVDPKKGCNRDDHGHLPDHGLTAHIDNLYQFLDDLQKRNPNLTVESCSSGGLRWDLGIAQHVDLGFTSDPDWPEHALSTFWASSLFFPAEKLLGWCDSEWRGDHAHQDFKIADQDLQRLEFLLAVTLLGAFGLSQKLSEFTALQVETARRFVTIYKEEFRPRYQGEVFIRRMGAQPLRENEGVRTVGFAIESDHFEPLLLIYQLPGATNADPITYEPTDKSSKYRAVNLVTKEEIFSAQQDSFEFEVSAIDYSYLLVKFEKIDE
ncbi:MAG: alpha-galactosidase [Candidatus Nanopelagicaceae bacterium]|nr:alpha-galactosidase [Candidatus Nanopelagicaceae bacterium]